MPGQIHVIKTQHVELTNNYISYTAFYINNKVSISIVWEVLDKTAHAESLGTLQIR